MQIKVISGCDNLYGQQTDDLLKQHNAQLGHTADSQWYTIVALDGENYLGGATILAKWDYIFIDYLYVKEKRTGLGRTIMTKIEELAMQLGKRGLYLFTGAFQTPGFYVALGFTETGRIPALSNGKDEILYVKQFT